jgi:hypothetical protein
MNVCIVQKRVWCCLPEDSGCSLSEDEVMIFLLTESLLLFAKMAEFCISSLKAIQRRAQGWRFAYPGNGTSIERFVP